jgi:hypothetical protein
MNDIERGIAQVNARADELAAENKRWQDAERSRRNARDSSNSGSGPRPFAPIEGENEVVLISGADIEPEPVNWLWPNGLQRGAFNLLAGLSGGGRPI